MHRTKSFFIKQIEMVLTKNSVTNQTHPRIPIQFCKNDRARRCQCYSRAGRLKLLNLRAHLIPMTRQTLFLSIRKREQKEPVPQLPQKSRTTPFSRSLRWNCFGEPFVYLKPSSGMPMVTFAFPPEIYWHSRQWHCSLIAGSPDAEYWISPQ